MRPDLASYDVILVNSSAGKDSQAMLDLVVELATAADVLNRITVVHADLGRVEWPGTRELAERQAGHYGARFVVVQRTINDLLDQVEARRMWPDAKNRYCTSDHKRGPIRTVMTRLVSEVRAREPRQVRVLNCMGLRSQESSSRAKCDRCKGRPSKTTERACHVCLGTGKRQSLTFDAGASNGYRHVDLWLPILEWTVEDVWARIAASGVEHHKAYDLGMSRLSCCFCVFAPRAALMLAGRHNSELLAQYAALEVRIGHRFRHDLAIADIQTALSAGDTCEEVRS